MKCSLILRVPLQNLINMKYFGIVQTIVMKDTYTKIYRPFLRTPNHCCGISSLQIDLRIQQTSNQNVSRFFTFVEIFELAHPINVTYLLDVYLSHWPKYCLPNFCNAEWLFFPFPTYPLWKSLCTAHTQSVGTYLPLF